MGAVANDRAGGERTQLARPFKSALPHGPPMDYRHKPIPEGSILDADQGSIFNAD